MPKKAAVPSTQGLDPASRRVIDPLVEAVETITGRRTAKLAHLPDNATLADVIAGYNALLDRLQS